MLHPDPRASEPLRPVGDGHDLPSRNAAAQRRAMQAAIANAVRAMRSTGTRRGSGAGTTRPPRSG